MKERYRLKRKIQEEGRQRSRTKEEDKREG
jgi:hypothetical protein